MYFGLGPFGFGFGYGNQPQPQQNPFFPPRPPQQQQAPGFGHQQPQFNPPNNQGGLGGLFDFFMNPLGINQHQQPQQ
jgi:hypothetical protein